MPIRGGAMAKLARFLTRLDQNPLPVHITPPVQAMIEAMAAKLGGAPGLMLRQMLRPALTNSIVKLLGPAVATFDPLLRNTASPTSLHGSPAFNVIPGEVSVEVDGRLLPGLRPEVLVAEVQALAGPEGRIEVTAYDEGPAETEIGLFGLLSETLRASDPEGEAIPLVLPGVTDGRHLASLGIQSYGFTPMQLPPDFAFTQRVHAADERIPAASVAWGAEVVYRVICAYK
jgi:acetylornithine deacetylase/succinyl-diaminopimelate desuccinylase-like protein